MIAAILNRPNTTYQSQLSIGGIPALWQYVLTTSSTVGMPSSSKSRPASAEMKIKQDYEVSQTGQWLFPVSPHGGTTDL
jgi:hypothetical protein